MTQATPTQKRAQRKLDQAIEKRIQLAIDDPENHPLSAAFISAVTKRYEHVQPVTLPGSARDRIIRNLRLAGSGKLPPIDTENADRATA